MEADNFTPEGREVFPSLYTDYQQVGEYALWPREALEERLLTYSNFLKGDIMPRARETSEKIILHLLFELTWRDMQEEL